MQRKARANAKIMASVDVGSTKSALQASKGPQDPSSKALRIKTPKPQETNIFHQGLHGEHASPGRVLPETLRDQKAKGYSMDKGEAPCHWLA